MRVCPIYEWAHITWKPLDMARYVFLIAIILLGKHPAAVNGKATLPSPISVPPSEYWDGDDGPWSTFFTSIGTPPQTVRLLPSTSGNAIWPIFPEGCTPQDPPNCPDLRGAVFDYNKSSTWSEIGFFELAVLEEEVLGYGGNNGDFGYDNATLGLPFDNLPVVTHQIVEGVATKDFYLGTIGLSPLSINLSSFDDSHPSLLASLKNLSKVPSLSWAYTAGASYRTANGTQNAYGSLILGGYDSRRFEGNDITFPFGPDAGQELIAGLQNITFNASSSLLYSTNIFVFLDSLVPDLWLPVEACDVFQKVFGLEFNVTANQYTMNDTTLNYLAHTKPQVTFEFGLSGNATKSVTVAMPMDSFISINGNGGKGSNRTRNFPLRQAQNASQYTLGRVFFQEAYIIADYERSNFSIRQAVFPQSSSGQELVPIHPPGGDNEFLKSHGPLLSRRAIAGIAVGSVCFAVGTVVLVMLTIKQRRAKIKKATVKQSEQNSSGMHEGFSKPELSGATDITILEVPEGSAQRPPVELQNSGFHEIYASQDIREMPTSAFTAELPSPTTELNIIRHSYLEL